MNTSDNGSRAEFDSIKDHLESYVSLFQPPPTRPASRVPSRHISHLTQMASKALHRDIPSMAAAKSREKGRTSGVEGMDKVHVGWDELKDYAAKEAWRGDNLERDLSQMESLDCAGLERRWRQSWARDGSVRCASSSRGVDPYSDLGPQFCSSRADETAHEAHQTLPTRWLSTSADSARYQIRPIQDQNGSAQLSSDGRDRSQAAAHKTLRGTNHARRIGGAAAREAADESSCRRRRGSRDGETTSCR